MAPAELERLVVTLEEEMFAAAEELRFEYAAKLRDEIKQLRRELHALGEQEDDQAIRKARRLFARVLDAPGGGRAHARLEAG